MMATPRPLSLADKFPGSRLAAVAAVTVAVVLRKSRREFFVLIGRNVPASSGVELSQFCVFPPTVQAQKRGIPWLKASFFRLHSLCFLLFRTPFASFAHSVP